MDENTETGGKNDGESTQSYQRIPSFSTPEPSSDGSDFDNLMSCEKQQGETYEQPSTSGYNPWKTEKEMLHETIKREEQDTNDGDDDTINWDPEEYEKEVLGYYTHQTGENLGTNVKTESNIKTEGDHEGGEEMFEGTTQSGSPSEFQTEETEEKAPDEDAHALWAKLLAAKVREMPPKVRERFKVHVDSLALDAIDGDWIPVPLK